MRSYPSLALPVEGVFEEVLPVLVHRPFRSDLGYTISPVRGDPGLRKLDLNGFPPRTFHGTYEVDGDVVRFLGFGRRASPYRRLEQKDRFFPFRF